MTFSKSHTLFPILLVALIFSTSSAFGQRGRSTPGVIITRAKQEQKISKQSFVGTVTPIGDAVIGSAVDGRVQTVLFKEGDYVSFPKGSKETLERPALVGLATKSIGIQISAAEVELNLRQLAHQELEKSLPKEIELLKAQVAEAKTQTELAKNDYQRMKNANQTNGAVSQQEMDASRSTYQKNLLAQKGLEIQHKKLFQTIDLKLKQSLAKVKAQKEEVKRLSDIRSKYTIRAPFEGYIVGKTTEVGHWVSKGEDVARLVQANPIEIVVNVPQSIVQRIHASLDQNQIAKGEETLSNRLSAEVNLESSAVSLKGIVHSIVPQADLRSRSFPVKIRLENPKTKNGHLLKSGMLANVKITIGQPSNKVLVKKDALVLNGKRSHVVAVSIEQDQKKGKTRLIPVVTGASFQDWIEVEGDIKKGQWVVTEGNERLRPDQVVDILQKIGD